MRLIKIFGHRAKSSLNYILVCSYCLQFIHIYILFVFLFHLHVYCLNLLQRIFTFCLSICMFCFIYIVYIYYKFTFCLSFFFIYILYSSVITYLLSVCLSLFFLYCCHSYFPLLSRCLWHGRNTAFWPEKKKSNISAISTVIQKHQIFLLSINIILSLISTWVLRTWRKGGGYLG